MTLELAKGRGWKSFEVYVRKSLGCLEETIGRNMDVKGDYSEVSGRKTEGLPWWSSG